MTDQTPERDNWLNFERPSFHICAECGAAVPFDAAEGHGQAVEMHYDWHKKLDAAIAANRPDPRSAFIGG